MKKIGITGGIGSGKSLVCRIFAVLGVPVYDADSRARWLTDNDPEIVAAVTRLLGSSVYHQGRLQRDLVAQKVFPAPELLQQLNAIIHPAVGKDFDHWISGVNTSYVLKEAALLFESGSSKQLDAVIHVTATEKIRMARVLQRDPQRTRSDVEQIMARQMSEDRRRGLSDVEIINDDSCLVIPQVLRLHAQFSDN